MRIPAALAIAAGLAAAAGAPPQAPGPKDKCPVCGMFVAKFPEWTAAARHPDGSVAYFDGAKDLFTFLKDPGRYGRTGAPAGDVWVKDYYQQRMLEARKAWFVAGSKVLGPMGRELVPCATEAEARTFMKDHGGSRILRFAEVTPEVLRGLQ